MYIFVINIIEMAFDAPPPQSGIQGDGKRIGVLGLNGSSDTSTAAYGLM